MTKAQFTRTIQNYQKAYRKKVQGLKTELISTRASVTKLNKKVTALNSFKRIHLPSLIIGVAVGFLAKKLLGTFLKKGAGAKKAAPSGDEDAVVVEVVEAASGATEAAKKQPEDAGEQIAVEALS